jgi:hypothetical protein
MFELLSRCLNEVKTSYIQQYDDTKKERNFLLIEPIIQQKFKSVVDTELENDE